MEEPENNSTKVVVTAIIAFLVGFGSAWLYLGRTANVPVLDDIKDDNTITEDVNDATTDDTEDGVSVNPTSSDLLVVKDQTAGAEVTVEKSALTEVGWVVVRENDGAGNPGRILGAQLFDVGNQTGKVELLRGTVAGNIYFAMVYTDNGDHAFDPKKDLPLVVDGKTAMATFKAQ